MKYIAHRGLTKGPNARTENHPDTIKRAWSRGFHCEIDVWVVDDKVILGHDSPQYEVTPQYILDNSHRSWYHCKNFEALDFFSNQMLIILNYFWHENDRFTLTSLGHIWTFPNRDNNIGENSVCVLPEVFLPLEACKNMNCYGICSDYIEFIRLIRGDK